MTAVATRAFIAAATAILAVAVGAPARADLVFAPPAEWGLSLGGVRGKALASWRALPVAGAAFITLVEDPFGGNLDQYVALNRNAMAHVRGTAFHPTETSLTLCNGTPARLLTFATRDGDADVIAEQLYTGAKARFYVVSYVRPAKQAAAPEAERALTTVCPK